MSQTNDYLVEVSNLKTWFPIRAGVLRKTVGYTKAVDGVSFRVRRGRTLGLVGESGCGKTTVGRTLLRLSEPAEGRFVFDGEDVFAADAKRMKHLLRDMQMIFQDPYGSLNPRMNVEQIVSEPLLIHRLAGRSERRDKAAELLDRVGLSAEHLGRYPHEFSGGQRQRIGIARALALEPKLLICDEPVSALDVSIQSQIINLLQDLQEQMGLTYIFIAHDLAVVEHISEDVAVMYLGRIVEFAQRDALYADPRHPYTQALLSAIPEPMPVDTKQRMVLGGEVPSPSNPPSGCPFHPRCPLAEARCREEVQSLDPKDPSGTHLAACWKAKTG